MSEQMSPTERRELAAMLRCNERFLYQCLTGRNAMQPADAVRAEQATAGRLRRWDLRRNDWHLIWPELIGAAGAPAVQADEVRDAA
jgi:DNA-binding transcriptional regulator YdaS (Cro superfamily)